MGAKNPQDMVKNYLQGMAGSSTKYQQGIDGVNESPTAKAASPDAEARYLQGTQQAVASGRRNQALMSVSLQQWKDAAKSKGAARLSTGAQAAAGKMQQVYQKWGPIYQQASEAARALPKGGEAEALAKVAASMRVMKQAAGKS